VNDRLKSNSAHQDIPQRFGVDRSGFAARAPLQHTRPNLLGWPARAAEIAALLLGERAVRKNDRVLHQ